MRDFNSAYANYGGMGEAVRRCVASMGKAMWWFAAIKEQTWYNGYAALTKAIHYLEHEQPEYIDQLKDIMAKIGLPLPYPAIPEFLSELNSIPQTLETCIALLDEVNAGLSDVIDKTDNELHEPLARYAENIQMANYRDRQWLMEAKAMAEGGDVSATSYDSWLANTLKVPQKE